MANFLRKKSDSKNRAPIGLLLGMSVFMLPAVAGADVVTDWNIATTNAVGAALPAERGSFLDFSLVHIAMFDAINAIDPRYESYISKFDTPPTTASADAAAATAAYKVLDHYFQSANANAFVQSAYATALANIPDGASKTAGIAVGNKVAADVLAWRENDGRYGAASYVFGSGPGAYQLTQPMPPIPINTWAPRIRPVALPALTLYRADGPAALGSETYARDYNEVKSKGATQSTSRTAAETEIGLFHTENPTIYWARNLRNLTDSLGLDLLDHARLMAVFFVSINDAGLSCWESKYFYNFWRPSTAIRAGDTDGNDYTTPDASWTPLAPTPQHPEYPAAHGCASGSVAEVIRREIDKDAVFSFYSDVTKTTHLYNHPEALVTEVINARVYGGMHFRKSGEDGMKMGRQVAHWVISHKFRPQRPLR